MKVWSDLKVYGYRDSRPLLVTLNSNSQQISVESEVIILSSSQDIYLSANPVFIAEDLNDEDCRILKVLNNGNYQITFSNSAIIHSSDLVLSPQQSANFIRIPDLGWLYQSTGASSTTPETGIRIVSRDILPPYSLVNIYKDIDGLNYCRLADRRYGTSQQADGFVKSGYTIGDFAVVSTSGLLTIPDADFNLNQNYYLGESGQIVDPQEIDPTIPGNFGTLIQFIGRAVNQQTLIFDPSVIGVNKSTQFVLN